jgi:hypothetical protein
MDIMLLLLGIALLVILYQIYEGEIMSSMKYGVKKTNRKTEPFKFWANIVVQLVVWSALVLFQLGYIGQ